MNQTQCLDTDSNKSTVKQQLWAREIWTGIEIKKDDDAVVLLSSTFLFRDTFANEVMWCLETF